MDRNVLFVPLVLSKSIPGIGPENHRRLFFRALVNRFRKKSYPKTTVPGMINSSGNDASFVYEDF